MPVNVTLMFGACETRRCVNMEITDDQSPEQDESFSFHLTGTSDPRIELNPVYGLVDIVDNDRELLHFFKVPYNLLVTK